MTTVSWIGNSGGLWSDGADWSGGVEPGSTNDVYIDTQSPVTITYSTGSDTISSLTMENGTLQFTGGSLRILGDTYIGGSLYETSKSATLTVGGALSMVEGFSQTAGTLDISSGTFDLSGTADVLGGTVTGDELYLNSNSSTELRQGLKLTTAIIFVNSASIDLEGNISYAGQLSSNYGLINLQGNNMTLGGSVTVSAELLVTGPGTISVTHQSTTAILELSGATVLKNTGHMAVSSVLGLYTNSSGDPTIINEKLVQ